MSFLSRILLVDRDYMVKLTRRPHQIQILMTTYLQCAQKGQDSIMYSIIDFIQKMPEVIYVGYLWNDSYKDFSQNRSFMIQFISTLTSGNSVNRDCGVILLTSLY